MQKLPKESHDNEQKNIAQISVPAGGASHKLALQGIRVVTKDRCEKIKKEFAFPINKTLDEVTASQPTVDGFEFLDEMEKEYGK